MIHPLPAAGHRSRQLLPGTRASDEGGQFWEQGGASAAPTRGGCSPASAKGQHSLHGERSRELRRCREGRACLRRKKASGPGEGGGDGAGGSGRLALLLAGRRQRVHRLKQQGQCPANSQTFYS